MINITEGDFVHVVIAPTYSDGAYTLLVNVLADGDDSKGTPEIVLTSPDQLKIVQ